MNDNLQQYEAHKTKTNTPSHPNTKKLVIIRGRGTPREQRIETDITLYWCNSAGRWVTIPKGGK